MVRAGILLLSLLSSSVGCATKNADGPVQDRTPALLRYKFTPGQDLAVQTTLIHKTAGKMKKHALEHAQRLDKHQTWQVRLGDKNEESWTVESVVGRVVLKGDLKIDGMAKDTTAYDFDTDWAPGQEGVFARHLAARLRGQVGTRTTYHLQARGNADLRFGDQPNDVPSVHETIVLPALPEAPVKPGESWTQEAHFQLANGCIKSKAIWTYAGRERRDGRLLHRINATAEIDLSGVSAGPYANWKTPLRAAGHVLLDADTGVPVERFMTSSHTPPRWGLPFVNILDDPVVTSETLVRWNVTK